MSSTESSISQPLFIVRREPSDESCKDTIEQLKSPNAPTSVGIITTNINTQTSSMAQMTLIISYAYCAKQETYQFNTKVIKHNRVLLNDLMASLSKSISLDLYSISYSDNTGDVYFSCGKYPFNLYIYCELTPSRTLNIKLRQVFSTNLKTKLDLLELDDIDQSNIEENKKTNYYINQKSKRARERTIGEIIQKVFLWKKIYAGVIDRRGRKIRLTLKEAADHTGISQKSLDEYDHQLKYGRLLGFDFNKYKQSKVGVLRGFVRNQMKDLDSNEIEQVKLGKLLKDIRKSDELTTEQYDLYSLNEDSV